MNDSPRDDDPPEKRGRTLAQQVIELERKFDRDIAALNKVLEKNREFHDSIRQAFVFGMGVDILDSKSIIRFQQDYQALIAERSKLLAIQMWVGRSVIGLCISGVTAIAAALIQNVFIGHV